ncbi:MAG: PAS domain S-box protein [Bacteroidales bacterium]|nr:PAS domain S-box protein [Bacteroidales bacterium]
MEKISENIADLLPVGIYRTNPDGKILYANKALANILEYNLEELLNISVKDLYEQSNDRDDKIRFLTNSKNPTICQEINLKTKSGKTILIKDTGNIIKDNNNKVLYFDGILEDISKTKLAEKALIESEARYKILTDITVEGIIIHKMGIIVDVNPSVQKMTGYSSDFVKGKNILDFIHPNSLDFAKSKLNTGFSGSFEIKIICSNGSNLDLEIKAKDVIIKGEDYRVVAFSDITERKKIEKNNLALSTAVTQSPTSIIITDTKGIIEYINPKFIEVTGYTLEEVIGKNPNILKTGHTVSEDYKVLWETITNGDTWRGEFLNKRKNGDHYWELASISPIIDEKGTVIKYIAVKEDITERKKTEDALIRSEKELTQANATKNMFFSIIAHDLKGPMGNFTQLLDLLKENFNEISDEEKLDYVNILLGLSGKTNKLLEDLLLWARIQMNTLEFDINTVNLNSLVNFSMSIVEEKAIGKNIKIISDIDNISVKINESSVNTVIRNLLSNSIKFSHKNSTIYIKSKISKSKNSIEISVKDNGIGIPKESIDKLFKIETTFSTYGTNKEKGTGLGLIICKELIEKNSGTIWVESEEDLGSTFFFTLPI